MLGNPLTSRANAALETIDNDFQNVVISVTESTIHVSEVQADALHLRLGRCESGLFQDRQCRETFRFGPTQRLLHRESRQGGA